MAGIFVALLAARDLRLSRLRVHLSRAFVSRQNLAPIAVFVGRPNFNIPSLYKGTIDSERKHSDIHANLKKIIYMHLLLIKKHKVALNDRRLST